MAFYDRRAGNALRSRRSSHCYRRYQPLSVGLAGVFPTALGTVIGVTTNIPEKPFDTNEKLNKRFKTRLARQRARRKPLHPLLLEFKRFKAALHDDYLDSLRYTVAVHSSSGPDQCVVSQYREGPRGLELRLIYTPY